MAAFREKFNEWFRPQERCPHGFLIEHQAACSECQGIESPPILKKLSETEGKEVIKTIDELRKEFNKDTLRKELEGLAAERRELDITKGLGSEYKELPYVQIFYKYADLLNKKYNVVLYSSTVLLDLMNAVEGGYVKDSDYDDFAVSFYEELDYLEKDIKEEQPNFGKWEEFLKKRRELGY